MRWHEIINELQQAKLDFSAITATKGDEFDKMRTGGGGGQKPPKPPKKRDDRPERPEKKFVIAAEVYSDDHQAAAEFEALGWFEQASDEEIKGLIRIGFAGDYEADYVAQWEAERNEWVQHVFDYVSECRQFTDQMGFECRISEDDAFVWLAHYRPHLVDPDYTSYS
jgi:hypothetical protein